MSTQYRTCKSRGFDRRHFASKDHHQFGHKSSFSTRARKPWSLNQHGSCALKKNADKNRVILDKEISRPSDYGLKHGNTIKLGVLSGSQRFEHSETLQLFGVKEAGVSSELQNQEVASHVSGDVLWSDRALEEGCISVVSRNSNFVPGTGNATSSRGSDALLGIPGECTEAGPQLNTPSHDPKRNRDGIEPPDLADLPGQILPADQPSECDEHIDNSPRGLSCGHVAIDYEAEFDGKPLEELPQALRDFREHPAHKFWTWSAELQQWFHNEEDGSRIFSPEELN
ncbi:hypothetical protein EV126DRAFT_253975 [Verticillium dahliae]|nr:hypothetical protein EV126DRAFT_253975 [Verticillium dahliae]